MTSAAPLAIVIKMQNETAAGLKQLRDDLKRSEDAANGLGARLSKVGSIASGFIAASVVQGGFRALVGGLQSSVAAAEESNRVNAQLESVLKSTGGAAGVTADQARNLASALQLTTRFSDEQVLSVENLLLTFTRIGKDIFPEATKAVLNMSTAMGQDTKSSAIQLGKALQDPIAGLTALRRVGVAFTDDQQKLIKNLVESGRGMEAQRMILAELNKEFGGSAENLTNYEKTMRRLQVAADETKETIGNIVVGGLIKLSEWFDEHQGDIENFISKFGPAFEALKTQVGERIGGIVATVGSLIDSINSVSDLVSDIAHGRWQSAWEDMLQVVTNFGKTMLNNIVATFGALPNIIIDAVNKGIDAVNNIKIPEKLTVGIGPLSQSVPIPGGGGGLGIPNIPNIPTKPFDISGAIEQMEKLGESAMRTGGNTAGLGHAVDDFGESTKKAKDATKTLGEVLLGAVSKMGAAASALFSRPTREQATINLRVDRAQQAFDAFERSLDPARRGIDMLKQAADASARAFNLHRLAMNDQSDALSDDMAAIDRQIRDIQRNAPTEGSGGGGRAVGGFGGGAGNASFGGPGSGGIQGIGGASGGGGQDSRITQLERRREDLGDQQQDLQRKIRDEEKAFQRQQLLRQQQIEAQESNLTKKEEQAKKELTAAQDLQKVWDQRKKIMQDELVLADQTLLTDQKQAVLAAELLVKTQDFTGKIQLAADAAGVTLVAGFDNAMNAEGELANQLRTDTIPAFQTTTGLVRDLGNAIAPLLSMLRGSPSPSPGPAIIPQYPDSSGGGGGGSVAGLGR